MLKLISSEKWSGGLNVLRPDSNYGFWMGRPAVQQKRQDLQSGQIGLSGLKRNIKAPLSSKFEFRKQRNLMKKCKFSFSEF